MGWQGRTHFLDWYESDPNDRNTDFTYHSHIEADELYGKVNKERKRFEWLKDDGECDHYWNFDKPKDKNDIEYQMKYLADQLEAGKMYRLSDIITDKVKKKVGQ